MQSETVNELAAALSKAQGEFSAIPKDDLNPFFKSKYAGLPDVVKTAAPVLSANGLSISQFIHQNELGEDMLKTYLLHSSGQFIEHSMKLYLGKLDSQGMGSATTYARRYSYMSVLGLVADEDDDGNKPSSGGSNGESRGRSEGSKYERGGGNDDFDTIIDAALLDSSNSFIVSLAEQIAKKGTLTDNQIASGVPKALKIVNERRPAPGPPPLRDGEEPF
jgi:hypothetical protein